jgi:hypothetical protein
MTVRRAAFVRSIDELTGGRHLSPEELSALARLEGRTLAELERELANVRAEVQHDAAWRAIARQASGPEEGGP